jgi:hypothetical protein
VNSDDLVTKLNDHPFKPFRIRMVNSTIYDVTTPWMLFVTESSATVATEVGKTDRGYDFALDWKTVSIHHMMEFTDLPASRGSKRKAS